MYIEKHDKKVPIGHRLRLHALVSDESPAQMRPPCKGDGLSQDLL